MYISKKLQDSYLNLINQLFKPLSLILFFLKFSENRFQRLLATRKINNNGF